MQELDFLFSSDPNGFVVHNNQAAVQNRMENWISTPRGSFFGKPNWGHTLRQFLHEPPTDTLLMLIEAELAETLEEDLPMVELVWVRAEATNEFDGYRLKIGYQTAEFSGTVETEITK